MQMRLSLNNAIGVFFLISTLFVQTTLADGHTASADSRHTGVLVMAHGGDSDWNEAVERVVEPLRASYPIEIAFGMAKTSTMRSAVERLEAQGVDQIAVVRMFISGESFLENTEIILGLREPKQDTHTSHHNTPAKPDEPMNHDSMDSMDTSSGHSMEPPTPIDTDSTFYLSVAGVAATTLIDDILVERVQSLSIDPSTESILILAHGPGDDAENQRWLADMKRRTELLRSLGDFIDIRCETLREDWPGRRAEAEKRINAFVESHNEEGNRVIVVPFRVAGFGPYREVLEGLSYTADGQGFCPHPNMTTWIDQTARKHLPSLPEHD
jgi:sirohydrochlorin ferrochelatase